MHTSPYVCCSDCLIFSDSFQRAELGCQWETAQGSWSIVNQHLRESGNTGALAVPFRAAGDRSFYVIGHTPELVNGAVHRVIGNYVDSDNYFFAEFEFSATEVQVRIYRRAAGNDDLLKSEAWDVNWLGWSGDLLLCLSHRSFLAEFSPDASHDERYAVCQAAPSLHTLGYRAGLGNAARYLSSTTASFSRKPATPRKVALAAEHERSQGGVPGGSCASWVRFSKKIPPKSLIA